MKYSIQIAILTSLIACSVSVYLKLGADKTLAAVIAKDRSLPNASYKRAWDIVNTLENFNDFIDEIRQ